MMREEKNGFRDILARVIFQHIARQRHDSGRVSIMSKLTESDRVFDGIVTDILAGVLRPRDQLSERELVSRFGVSRTPVREAVKRLLERGFIEPGPRGVATVIDISLEDLRKLYALRQQLESTAAREIVANIAPQEISELKEINKLFGKALEQRDLVKMLEVRADFHAVLSAATRNRWLEQVLVMLRNKAYMVRHYHWQDFERAAATLDIHTQMIKALEQRDEEQFVALVSQQIGAAITVYENRLHAPSWNVPQGKQRTTAPKRRVTSSDKTANSSPAVKRNYRKVAG